MLSAFSYFLNVRLQPEKWSGVFFDSRLPGKWCPNSIFCAGFLMPSALLFILYILYIYIYWSYLMIFQLFVYKKSKLHLEPWGGVNLAWWG